MHKHFSSALLFMGFLSFVLACFSCSKPPVVIIETVYETDTIIVTQYDTTIVTIHDTIILVDTINLLDLIDAEQTTFICVRHAETSAGGVNPDLSQVGLERAQLLSDDLVDVDLSAIYTTDFERTRKTGEASANDQGKELQLYNKDEMEQLVDGILEEHHGETVLVVGHSKSTPDLLNLLIGVNVYEEIPSEEFDNLYLVSVLEKGSVTITHLRY